MDEPAPLFKSVSTKYLIPLLAPSVILKSTLNSKFLYFLIVTISPPLVDSAPSEFNTFKIPFSIFQPPSGKVVSLAPRHPSVVFPSHSSFQPSWISNAETLLSIQLA